jgi:hypothetical protein
MEIFITDASVSPYSKMAAASDGHFNCIHFL